jgi:hypothetical protein
MWRTLEPRRAGWQRYSRAAGVRRFGRREAAESTMPSRRSEWTCATEGGKTILQLHTGIKMRKVKSRSVSLDLVTGSETEPKQNHNWMTLERGNLGGKLPVGPFLGPFQVFCCCKRPVQFLNQIIRIL